MQQYPSIVLENAVNEFAKLPGIGRKTALRLALFLLKQKDEDVELFGNTMIELKKSVHFAERAQYFRFDDTNMRRPE